jgi:hypothetical protein
MPTHHYIHIVSNNVAEESTIAALDTDQAQPKQDKASQQHQVLMKAMKF